MQASTPTSTSPSPFRASLFARTVSYLVTATLFCFSLRPLSASAQPFGGKVPLPQLSWAAPPSGPAPEAQYAEGLAQLVTHVRRAKQERSAASAQDTRERLRALQALDADVDESFAQVGRELQDKKLAPVLLARHQAAEEEFRTRRTKLRALAQALDAAQDDAAARDAAVRELDTFLAASQQGPRHHTLDVKKLPWSVEEPTLAKPALSPQGFTLATAGATAQLAPGGSAPLLLAPAIAPELAETDDAQLTPAVLELAATLNHDPVRIYNWVRNNVVYVPSFGSIQGSDVTLSKKRGNAFDTSSLLIALLRASGIAARYVYGTIEVPASAAMNWVGGVSSVEAAQQLWAQGGVPNTRLASGGRITHVQLEHVWVEAFVDFVPSRGAKHRQGDTWVALDASYKQYTYGQPLAAAANPPVDADAVQAAALAGAVRNEAEGWVQNVDPAPVAQAALDYLTAFNASVRSLRINPTFGEVYGSQTIVAVEPEQLSASLPYRTVATAARYADLPDSLTHKFRYTVYGTGFDYGFGDPLLSFEAPLPTLAGKKVMLVYMPASQADADLIASYLPKPHADGSPPTAAEYAALRLPAYLIHLRPELRVEGVTRATGQTVTMGADLQASGAFTQLDLRSGWDETTDSLTAGQVTAIGLNLQGMDRAQLSRLKDRLATAKARIEAHDITGLTGEQVTGDILTETIWSYFSALDSAGRTTQWRSGIVDLPGLSFGLAHVDLQVSYSFLVARSARPDGISLDVGHLRNVRWSKTNDAAAWRTYNRIMGQHASAMEHHVPETLFVGPQTPGEAVSAVKLLNLAAAAGQRIYTLTQANIATALPHLSLSSSTLGDIQAAVAVGKEVTVHQSPVTLNGWTGAGYIVIDPQTGAGGYLIEGGANGGKLLAAIAGLMTGAIAGMYVAVFIAEFVAGFLALGPFLVLLAIVALILAAIVLLMYLLADDMDQFYCFTGGAMTGFNIAMIWAPLAKFVQVIMNLVGWGFVAGNALWQCL